MTEKILCRAIVEVVGKPKEHVEEAINMVVETAKEIKGLKIERKEIAEVKTLEKGELGKADEKLQEKTGSLFSTFAEIEFLADSIDVISSFCFDFLPSSLEIIEPEKIEVNLQDVSRLMNDQVSRLQRAEHIVKTLKFENSNLQTNAQLLLRNMILVSIGAKEKKIDELSKTVGISSEQLKPFLDDLISKNFIEEKEGSYTQKSKVSTT